ncbi:MAG: hypothetical protein ACE5RC_02770, partial [Nitrosopumilus sp.]
KLNNIGTNLDQTVVTQELLDEVNSDLVRIKEIVIELQNLGFDGEAIATRIGTQMVGTVSFFDENTSELLFETQIPDGALSIFTTFALNDEYAQNGVVLSFDQSVDLLLSSSVLVDVLTNFVDDKVASDFVLSSIAPYHPSTGNTFFILIPIGISIALQACLANPQCAVVLDTALNEGGRLIIDTIYPLVTITGLKFNDKNSDGVQNDSLDEIGLSGWRFTMSSVLDLDPTDPFVETFTNNDGEFAFIEQHVPRYVDTIFITETQQDGWEVTTAQGLVHEISIPGYPLPILGQPTPVTVIGPEIFGNHFTIQSPITIIDVSPKLGGNACNIDNALTQDGAVAGLDYRRFGFGTGGLGILPGTSNFVAGCIAADFGSVQNLGEVTVNGGRDFNACGTGCFAGFCTRASESFSVYQSTNLQDNSFVGSSGPLPTSETLDNYSFTLVDPARYVTVCRTGSGPAASDIMVDSVISGSSSAVLSSLAFTSDVGGPYFYLELNQTSVNATIPDTVIIPLEVEWYAGFNATDVNIQINNMTSGISATVESTINSTNYKLFNVTFDVTSEAELGEHLFEILVEEIDSGFIIGELFQFNVN